MYEKQLENVLLAKDYEIALKEAIKDIRDCFIPKFLKQVETTCPDALKFFEKIPLKEHNFKYFSLYLRNKLHKCDVCDKLIRKENLTCSKTCQSKSLKVIEKRKSTNLTKYGVDNCFKSYEKMEFAKETNLKRYGVKYFSQSPEWLKKTIDTNLKKFGVEFASQSKEIQEKRLKTELEKYGCIASKTHNVIEKCKNTNLTKYGAKSFTQSNFYNEYVKHQNENLSWNQQLHFKHKENLNEEYVKTHFIVNNEFLNDEFKKYFNLSDFSVMTYKKKFNIIEHNKFSKSKMQKELFEFIPLSNNEKILNDRTIIKPLELDIVIPQSKLAIEYNGLFWHCDSRIDKKYHYNKQKLCLEKGYNLLTIFENDNLKIWKSIILNKLNLSTKIYARKCKIVELKYSQIKDFLELNHLQGGCSSKINLALKYNDEIVQVMTFSKPRFNKNYDWELLRMCSKLNFCVIGGASKLFNYFRKHYTGSIISYANKRFSNGSIYYKLGFKCLKETEPNYFYFKNDEFLSRVKCQKHKLKAILKHFDENKSEYQNMIENGYNRIFDCGNYVFVYS